jgi:nucleoid-associated protein YgaU
MIFQDTVPGISRKFDTKTTNYKKILEANEFSAKSRKMGLFPFS